MRSLLDALEFFTRLPLPAAWLRWRGFDAQRQAAAIAHWPAMGLLVGGLCGLLVLAVTALQAGLAGAALAAVLSTALGLWLTGAMHEDGLADLSDGLGGSLERERALAIMKDPHIGTYGVCTLVLALLLKCGLLAALAWRHPVHAALALVLAHVASRWWGLLLARRLPYLDGRGASKSQAMLRQVSARLVWIGMLWCGLAWIGAFYMAPALVRAGVWAWLTMAVVALYLWRLLARRLQGVTGDALGAAQQLTELACYLGLVLALDHVA